MAKSISARVTNMRNKLMEVAESSVGAASASTEPARLETTGTSNEAVKSEDGFLAYSLPETASADDAFSVSTFSKKHPLKSLKPSQVYDVPVCLIDENPNNARKFFKQDTLDSLSDSIRTKQEQIPEAFILNGRFVLIDGARRLRALKTLEGNHLMRICLTDPVKNPLDLYLRSRNANLSESLTVYDDALGFKEILDSGSMNQEELATYLMETGAGTYNQPKISRLKALASLPRTIFNYMAGQPHLRKERTVSSLVPHINTLLEDGGSEDQVISLINYVCAEEIASAKMDKECEDWFSKNQFGKNSEEGADTQIIQKPKKKKPHGRVTSVVFESCAGEIKYFDHKKQVNLSLKDVSPDQFVQLKQKLLQFMTESHGVSGEGA